MEMEVAESAPECAVEKNAKDAGFCSAKPVSLEEQGAPAVAEEEEVEESIVVEKTVRDAVFSPAKPESLEEEGAPAAAAAEEEEDEESVIDLTSWQLHDLEDVELPQQATELDLTANRLSALDPRIGQMRRLKKLSLRQNLFTDEALQSLSHWPAIAGLQELVLRDNKLTKIPDVSTFKDLVIFDVSFNEISSLKGMSQVSPLLKEFYVSKNELTKIEELDHLHQLQILELGSNRLRVMEGLQNMAVLQELWLGRNRIRTVELCGLKSLVKISLQSNRLTSMLGFQDCIGLEELYLSHNGISKMEGLSTLVNLRVLDVSSNKLTAITGIENLTRLEDLWLNDNQIALLDGIDAALAGSKEKLTTIYLEHNPCAKDPSYTSILRATFPNIQQIDSNCY
uniref:Protein phosphatase 1 regulatory subunit 7 n=1 Tax=Araucaria cunninghamii TaxID=56994 RepID=A0A0D6R4N8_ARACU